MSLQRLAPVNVLELGISTDKYTKTLTLTHARSLARSTHSHLHHTALAL